MKEVKTLLLIVSACLSLNVLGQDTKWLSTPGGPTVDQPEDVAVDRWNNAFFTGKFGSTIDFEDTTLTVIGSGDIYVAKYDSVGNFLWVRTAGGLTEDIGVECAVDYAGNVYAAGKFDDSLAFDSTVYYARGNTDIWVAKWSGDGDLIWAKTFGGNRDDRVRGLDVDSAGFVYLGGRYRTLIEFDTIFLAGNGEDDIYAAKLDPDGNVLWAQSVGGLKLDFGEAVAADPDGNVIVVGSYFQNFATPDSVFFALGDEEIIVVKWDTDGNYLWAKSLGSIDRDYAEDVNTDEFGNIYVTGGYSDEAVFGTDTLPARGKMDMFVTKMDPDGNIIWNSISGAAADNDVAWGSEYDSDGNIYVTGWFRGNYFWGDTILLGTPDFNMLLGKIDNNGNQLWVRKMNEILGSDAGRGVSTGPDGHPCVAGSYVDTFIIDGDTLFADNFPDMFMGKFDKGYSNCIINKVEVAQDPTCDPATGLFDLEAKVYTYGKPTSGDLIVNGVAFPVGGSSPQTVILDSLLSDGLTQAIDVSYSADSTCTYNDTAYYTAPDICGFCSIDSITIDTIKNCKAVTNRFQISVSVYHSFPPDSGALVINGNEFHIDESPQVEKFREYADGEPVDIFAYFTLDSAGCNYSKDSALVAPAACGTCEIDTVFENGVGDCDPFTNTYEATVVVGFFAWPETGGVVINGQVFDIITSPDSYTLTGLIADGNPVDLEVYMEGDTTCSFFVPAAFTAPEACDTCQIISIEFVETSNCDAITQTYDAELTVTFANAPATGDLVINGDTFAVSASPMTVILTGLAADGMDVDVDAFFSDDSSCVSNNSALFTAPASCASCLITGIILDSLYDNCDPFTNLYDVDLTIQYSTPPATGDLEVNGQSFPISGSPQNITVSLPADGSVVSVTALFTDAGGCSLTVPNMFTAPDACDTCSMTSNLTADFDSLIPNSVFLSWDPVLDATAYRLQGRKTGTTNTGEVLAFTNFKVVSGLQLGTSYSWAVQSICPFDSSNFTAESMFTTLLPRVEGSLGDLADAITLYPNPASRMAYVVYESERESELQLKLMSMNGQQVYAEQRNIGIGQQVIEIPLEGISEGIYVLQVREEDRVGALRIVIGR